MSRQNRNRALARIYRELVTLAYSSPKLHQNGRELAELRLPLPIGVHWDRFHDELLKLWPSQDD